jgi:hypothetical protein
MSKCAVFDMARSAGLGARADTHAAGGASFVGTWRCATKHERGSAALEIDERRAAADGECAILCKAGDEMTIYYYFDSWSRIFHAGLRYFFL